MASNGGNSNRNLHISQRAWDKPTRSWLERPLPDKGAQRRMEYAKPTTGHVARGSQDTLGSASMNVTLLSHTADPLSALYVAYRTCYSEDAPEVTWEKIQAGTISRDRMMKFMLARLDTGHASPLEQVSFTFAISGVSRAFSHQFVRTRVGMSPEQQSQRYVVETREKFEYVTPPSIEAWHNDSDYNLARGAFRTSMEDAIDTYHYLVALGVPAEDARFVLPNAAATNLVCTINLAALLHMGDLRMCLRAQWEYRAVVGKMRALVHHEFPWLGRLIGPKCMAYRKGYCDESEKDWAACPLSKVRPHKSQVLGGE